MESAETLIRLRTEVRRLKAGGADATQAESQLVEGEAVHNANLANWTQLRDDRL